MEYIVILILDGVLAIDRRLFRRRLQSVVPDFDELWNNPEGQLERQEVVIGPRRSYAVAPLLGVMLGQILTCGMLFYRLDHPRPQLGPAPMPERVLLIAAFFGAPVIGVGLFWHWLRGGEMVLRASGIVLRYRKDRVFCPWAVFQIPQVQRGDRCVIRPWPGAVPAVLQSRGYTVVAAGPAIRTKPLSFRKDGRMILRDLYAVRLGELAELLLRLGRLLGADRPLPPLLERGDPIREDMC